PRMRWSGATGAIARCKNRSTGYVRKPRSAPAWRWTCGEKPKGQGVTTPSTPYIRHGLPEATRYPCYSLVFRDHMDSLVSTLVVRVRNDEFCSLPCERQGGGGANPPSPPVTNTTLPSTRPAMSRPPGHTDATPTV